MKDTGSALSPPAHRHHDTPTAAIGPPSGSSVAAALAASLSHAAQRAVARVGSLGASVLTTFF